MESFPDQISTLEIAKMESIMSRYWASALVPKIRPVLRSFYAAGPIMGLRFFVVDKRMIPVVNSLVERTLGFDPTKRLTPFHDKSQYIHTVRFAPNELSEVTKDVRRIKRNTRFLEDPYTTLIIIYGESADTFVLRNMIRRPVNADVLHKIQLNAMDFTWSLDPMVLVVDFANEIIYMTMVRVSLPPERGWKLQVESELSNHRNEILLLKQEIEELKKEKKEKTEIWPPM